MKIFNSAYITNVGRSVFIEDLDVDGTDFERKFYTFWSKQEQLFAIGCESSAALSNQLSYTVNEI
jgi:hypothetical protein